MNLNVVSMKAYFIAFLYLFNFLELAAVQPKTKKRDRPIAEDQQTIAECFARNKARAEGPAGAVAEKPAVSRSMFSAQEATKVDVPLSDNIFEVEEDGLRQEFVDVRNRMINLIEDHSLHSEFITFFNHRARDEKVMSEQDLLNATDASDCSTLLMWAVQHNNYRLSQNLLENGAQVNATAPNGETALTLGAKGASLSLVTLLLLFGANINVKKKSVTPLLLAASRNNPEGREICRLLLRGTSNVNECHASGFSGLTYAAKSANAVLCQEYIDRGGDVQKATIKKKTTPLMCAIKSGSLAACRVLVEAHANVNAVDAESISCLMHAVRGGNLEIVDLLLAHGAHLDLVDTAGKTALIMAASQKNRQLISLLLHYAFKRGQQLIITELACLRALAQEKLAEGTTEIAPHLLYNRREQLLAPFLKFLAKTESANVKQWLSHVDNSHKRAYDYENSRILNPDHFDATRTRFLREERPPLQAARSVTPSSQASIADFLNKNTQQD